eukprot:14283854-Ditylum_brightwellii.AAC.1
MVSAVTRQTSPKRTCFDEDPLEQTPTTAPTVKSKCHLHWLSPSLEATLCCSTQRQSPSSRSSAYNL